MATISLKFANKNGRLCLCATVTETQVRHYKRVEGLKNPNSSKWDSALQKFLSRSKDAAHNNLVIGEMLARYQQLLEEHEFSTGSELFAWKGYVESGAPTQKASVKSPGITLGEWVKMIVEEIKNPTRLKPSSSYQAYLTLFHKLEAEGKLINTPIADINDDSFVQLINWVNQNNLKKSKGGNFIGLMKIFRATISRARKARLTTYSPDFPYMDYAPVVHKISEKASDLLAGGGTVNSLTMEQMDKFRIMDLEKLRRSGEPVKNIFYYEIYRDFALLLYELKSRPMDVVKLHWDNLAYDSNTDCYTLAYIPAKKKNYGSGARHTKSALVVQYLSKEAVRIILKYRGKSKGGYVFPFPLNERRWDLDKPEDYHRYYYLSNHVCGSVNKLLHKVGQVLKLPFQLTLYAFRRSAITHAIIENRMPLAMIAKVAGTSVAMIESHYANYLHTLAAYR